jgi:Transcriptional regulator LmrA/YxaF-like, C-terminal domain
VPAGEAGELAVTLVAAIEGGFMLSRAARSPEPMRTAGRLMQRLVAAALTTTTDVPG